MKVLKVKCSDGLEYRVVEILGGEISKIERDGTYYNTEEDFIIGTNIEIL